MKIAVNYLVTILPIFFPIHNVYVVVLLKYVSTLGIMSFRYSNIEFPFPVLSLGDK